MVILVGLKRNCRSARVGDSGQMDDAGEQHSGGDGEEFVFHDRVLVEQPVERNEHGMGRIVVRATGAGFVVVVKPYCNLSSVVGPTGGQTSLNGMPIIAHPQRQAVRQNVLPVVRGGIIVTGGQIGSGRQDIAGVAQETPSLHAVWVLRRQSNHATRGCGCREMKRC